LFKNPVLARSVPATLKKFRPRSYKPQPAQLLGWPLRSDDSRYWAKVWKRALPHLGRRPLKLVRHVRGTTFYHKGKLPPVPEAVHRLTKAAKAHGSGSMTSPACSG
jgi:bifunctional non-homologous end joining protein LigD